MTRNEATAMLAAWDKKDIRELVAILEGIKEAVDEENETSMSHWPAQLSDYVDMSSLPTCEFPDAISGYPVWACDNNGMCLAGDEANEIEPLSEIIEYYAEKN